MTGKQNGKARRRFGRVRQLPSGRWQARYPGPDGQLRTAPTTFARRSDAERFLSEVETDIVRGEWFDPLAGRMALGQYALRWIEERDLSVRTAELYRGLLKNHITPSIGHLTLADLAPPGIRRWRRMLRDCDVSEGVIAKAYRLLHAVLTTAVKTAASAPTPATSKAPVSTMPPSGQSRPWNRSSPSPKPSNPATAWLCCWRRSPACAMAKSWAYGEQISHFVIAR